MSETATEKELSAKQRSQAFVKLLQAKKAPLDAEREKLQKALKAARIAGISAADKEAAKAPIRALHDKIRPLDELLVTANALKELRGKIAQTVAKELAAEIEGLS